MNPAPTFDPQIAIDSLSEQSGMEKTLIKQKVDEKIAKFSGLLTEQGALVLVSKELNAKLPQYEKTGQAVKLGELKPGMNNVDVHARVKIMDREKSYSKNGKEGKYVSLRLEDETGEAIYTFWNEQVDEAMQKGLRVGSMLALQNARAGSFNNMAQLSLGYNGTYTIDNAGIPTQKQNENEMFNEKKENAATFLTMQTNQFVRARVHVLDVLPGKGYYVKCGACGGKLQTRENNCPLCGAEGKVETRLLVPLLLDDGSKPVRAVAFENEVMSLYGKNKEEILDAMEEPSAKDALNIELAGKKLDLIGKAKIGMDNMSIELVINRITRVPFENE